MSTKSPSPVLNAALANVPKTFRAKVANTYLDLKRNCVESRYEASGVSAGKFCEVVLRYLQAKVIGTYTPFSNNINNFADECRRLVTAPRTAGNESERIILPRALVYLYTMRNKRGIGHVGGDVDANEIDIATMARTADWILCELIRINHSLSLEEAQDLVDSISLRTLPTIWEVAGKKRVLKDGLNAKDQTLLLLYSTTERAVLVEDLCEWVEYGRIYDFERRVIDPMHSKRLIEFEKAIATVYLSPIGAMYVEDNLL